MGVTSAMQRAAVARLLENAPWVALAATTTVGPAIFAPGQNFPDVFPRSTIEKPQKYPRDMPCGRKGWEVVLTLHHWAKGPEGSLTCGDLADAAETALDGDIAPEGYSILSKADHFEGQREVGDPDPAVQHLVQTFRYLVS